MVPFGCYCEVHDDLYITNMIKPCTHKGIAVDPSRNLQGSVKFFCLFTGKVPKHRKFTGYPMPNSVIKLVENGAKSPKRSHLENIWTSATVIV